MRYSKVPSNLFQSITFNAGVITTKFDPKDPTLDVGSILGATSGGTKVTYTPTFTDYGEDIDNCPKNSKELNRKDEDEIKVSGTFITLDEETLKFMLNAVKADTSNGYTMVTPPKDVDLSAYKELWVIGDYSEYNGENNGGYCAVHLKNVLNTGGFNWQTGDKSKGTFSFEGTCYYSIKNQDEVPFEVYFKAGKAEAEATNNTTEEKNVDGVDNADTESSEVEE